MSFCNNKPQKVVSPINQNADNNHKDLGGTINDGQRSATQKHSQKLQWNKNFCIVDLFETP